MSAARPESPVPSADRLRSRFRSLAVPLIAFPLLVGWSFFDPFHENVEKGNEEAARKEAAEALRRYEEAARVQPGSPIPDFNRGIVLGAEGEAEAARDAYLAAAASEDPAVAADALYNLGNLHLANQELEPAIDSYLKSLDLDPDDPEARRNLEIALRLQEEQQQQQQQQQQDQEKEQEQEQDQQDQQKDPESPPEDQQQQNEQPQEPEENEEQPEPQPEERLTREDAERLLNAVQSDELKVLEQLQPEQPTPGTTPNDW